MKIYFYDTHKFELDRFKNLAQLNGHTIHFADFKLNFETAHLAKDSDAVCCFVNDKVDAACLEVLSKVGVKLIALRCAGYNNVDLECAKRLQIKVVRVPEYSPYAVAEHTLTLLMSLNRHIGKAINRTREGNFSLDGLVGFDVHNKVVGVIGTGRIGQAFCSIMLGMGCKVLAHDKIENSLLKQKGVIYKSLESIYTESDIISLHVPLNNETLHLINSQALSKMKPSVILLNTGRGKLVDTHALIGALKSKKIRGAGLDVYEEEEAYFFEDHSDDPLTDDVLARLLSFPNVILTSHQAFLTNEALDAIATTTFANIEEFKNNKALTNEVKSKN